MEQLSGQFPQTLASGTAQAWAFLEMGGPSIWAIAALSVITLALVLWKIWDLSLSGAWTGGRVVRRALDHWAKGDEATAQTMLEPRRSCRALLVRAAMQAHSDPSLTEAAAKEETTRVARQLLARIRSGQRPLELIASIAPLLGLLGTVLGMIAAFQALQEAGSRADPATLAGGIWEALLTTAAGMAVAIPASLALTWFESVTDRLRLDMEDAATRVFLRPAKGTAMADSPDRIQAAAE